MRIVLFRPEHLNALVLQPAQSFMAGDIKDPAYGYMLAQSGGFTAMTEDGDVIACAGIAERWEGVGMAWALIDCVGGRHMTGLVKAIRGFLDHAAHWHRIEAAVDVGFEPGERFLRLLGFEYEGLARAYRPDGKDCTIWARIQLCHRKSPSHKP